MLTPTITATIAPTAVAENTTTVTATTTTATATSWQHQQQESMAKYSTNHNNSTPINHNHINHHQPSTIHPLQPIGTPHTVLSPYQRDVIWAYQQALTTKVFLRRYRQYHDSTERQGYLRTQRQGYLGVERQGYLGTDIKYLGAEREGLGPLETFPLIQVSPHQNLANIPLPTSTLVYPRCLSIRKRTTNLNYSKLQLESDMFSLTPMTEPNLSFAPLLRSFIDTFSIIAYTQTSADGTTSTTPTADIVIFHRMANNRAAAAAGGGSYGGRE